MSRPVESTVSTAWIALGSNLGDRAGTLACSVRLLEEAGVRMVRTSHLYETRPEGTPPGAAVAESCASGRVAEPLYLNAVVEVETDLDPRALLREMQRIEEHLGRDPRARGGPRTCDLDLLAFDGAEVEDAPDLCLPHPRLHARSFVLVPLCEIDVHWRHPSLGSSAGDLLARLPTTSGEVRLHSHLLGGGGDANGGGRANGKGQIDGNGRGNGDGNGNGSADIYRTGAPPHGLPRGPGL